MGFERFGNACQVKITPDSAINLAHLQAEMHRLDILLRRQVLRWQYANQDPADAFRGLYVSDIQAEEHLERPLGYGWGDTVQLPKMDEKSFQDQLVEAEQQIDLLTTRALAGDQPTRLEQLATAFGLDRFELDVLLLCLAPCLDLRYEKLYGYLQDDITRKQPGVNLALELLCPPGKERLLYLAYFELGSALFHHHLLRFSPVHETSQAALISRGLVLEETILAWLLGRYQPGLELGQSACLSYPQPGATDNLLPGSLLVQLDGCLKDQPLLIFTGPDRLAQHWGAEYLAVRRKQPVLRLELPAPEQASQSSLQIVQYALRDSRLMSSVCYIENWENCFDENSQPEPGIRTALYAHPGLIILASRAVWLLGDMHRQRRVQRVDFPKPDYPQRLRIWEYGLEQESPGCPFTGLDLAILAEQFQFNTDQILAAVQTAEDFAFQAERPVRMRDLFAAARAQCGQSIANLAQKVEPRYCWKDIVLPDEAMEQLHEICAWARQRQRVLNQWGFESRLPPGKGLTALFAGPSGTGKTMAAEVIANELGLDLYKIDLSSVVSKYIGETEKNLEQVFEAAQDSNAILFFDEADALFGKRSEVRDAHDRYANIEISYLLQKMEQFQGIAILATNLRGNLDEAFTRRLDFSVRFPFPEEAQRQRIWEVIFPTQTPLADNIDPADLARRFTVSGGHIRNIALGAAFLAANDGQVISLPHLLRAAKREYTKMGKLAEAGEFTPRPYKETEPQSG